MDIRIILLKKHILLTSKSKFKVSQMAAYINVSPSYLQKLFKAHMGVSPNQFVHEVRLEKSKELLETTFKRVKEVCYEVGFSDQRNFARQFRKKYNVSPSEHQKKSWMKIEEINMKYTKP